MEPSSALCPRCGAQLPAPGAPCPRCLMEMAAAAPGERSGETTIPGPPAAELGTIGPYRLLSVLGEGGMGTVYLAEQRAPIQRRVALKVVRAGLAGKEALARFEAERQALALMTHPGIARVLDAGTTARGEPYFVMEYVHGEPINAFCDKKRLSTAERIDLFRAVCAAVQHAHQRGILHRDLKPSNILVEEIDGTPRPRVIDFGLAKALNQRLTERTLFTERGAIVGTPEYMSPEQAAGEAFDVDTTTDVYSLGVVLYELLTGSLPHDPQKLREAGWLGMMKMLREDEPKKPSTQVSTFNAETASAVAGRRKTEARTLRRSLAGDLDWIVLKALDKERERRYPNVSDLAADLERHLTSEPVSASPPSAAYRARKFLARHSWRVAAVVAFALTLSVGLGASTAFYLRALDLKKRADDDARRSELAFRFGSSMAVLRDDSDKDGLFRFADSSFDEALALDRRDAALRLHSVAARAGLRFVGLCGLVCTGQQAEERCSADEREFLGPYFERTLSLIAPFVGAKPESYFGDRYIDFAVAAWFAGLDTNGERLLPVLRASLALHPGVVSSRRAEHLRTAWAVLAEILLSTAKASEAAGNESMALALVREAVSVVRQRHETTRPGATWQRVDFLGTSHEHVDSGALPTLGIDVRSFLMLAHLHAQAGNRDEMVRALAEARTLVVSSSAPGLPLSEFERESAAIRAKLARDLALGSP